MKVFKIIKYKILPFYISRKRFKTSFLSKINFKKKDYTTCIQKENSFVNFFVEKVNSLSKKNDRIIPTTIFDNFEVLSLNGDNFGKVLKKDNKIYRGIYIDKVDQFYKILNSGVYDALIELGYIPNFYITDYFTNEFGLILEVQKVEIVPVQIWCKEAIKDSCYFLALLNKCLKKCGFKLIDGHLNNVTFHNGKPMLVDIGSIIDINESDCFSTALVFAGGIKLISLMLGNSLLKNTVFFDNDNNLIWTDPFEYDRYCYECEALIKKFKKFHRMNSSHIISKMIFKMFYEYEFEPFYFNVLFSNKKSPLLSNCKNVEFEDSLRELLQSIRTDIILIKPFSVQDVLYTINACNKRINSIVSSLDLSNSIYLTFKEKRLSFGSYLCNTIYSNKKDVVDFLKSNCLLVFNCDHNYRSFQPTNINSIISSYLKYTSKTLILHFQKNKQNNEVFSFEKVVDFLDKNEFKSLEHKIIEKKENIFICLTKQS